MSEPTLASIMDGESTPSVEAPASAPVAGRQRTAVASGGNSISLQVGDAFEAIYNGSSVVAGKFGDSNLYKFTLIAPTTLTVVSKDKDSGVKSEVRTALDTGSTVTTFMKGNGNWLLGSIAEGQDVELRRVEDGVLPKGHKYEGTKVHTYEVLA